MDFIINCCDRAALMKGGKIVEMGKPEEIIKGFDEIEKELAESEKNGE
jgi:methyl coenzyme M reductase system subunit A2